MTRSSQNDTFSQRRNAYHEAGHAVAALMHGFNVIAVDIRAIAIPGLGLTLGSAELALPSPTEFLGKGEEAIMPVLIVLFAGVFAEQRVHAQAGLDVGHPQSDGQRVLKYAAGAICKPVKRNSVLVTPREEVQRQSPAIRACIENARRRSQEFVMKYGAAIDSVGEALAKSGVLSPSEVERIVSALFPN